MKKPFSKQTTLLLTSISLVLAHNANAATICVNPNSANCEATVANGIAAANPGDTVSIAPGVYFEEGLTINKPLTLKGSAKSIIDGGKIPDPANNTPPIGLIHGSTHAFIIAANDVAIQGVTIRNSGGNGIQIENGFTGATINNVTINNAGSYCIGSSSSNDDVAISGSKLLSCGSDGIRLNGNNVTISKNSVSHLDSGGIFVSGNGATITQNEVSVAADDDLIDVTGNEAVVMKNKIYNSNDYGIDVNGENPLVTLNTAEGVYGYAIHVSCSNNCSTAQVTKNKLSNTGQGEYNGIYISPSADGLLVEKNSINTTNEQAIYVSGSGKTTINQNKIVNAGAEESCIYAGSGAHVITNNQISGCRYEGIEAKGDGIEIAKNTIKGAGDNGIFADANNVNVHHNTISKSTGFGVITGISRTGIEITDNVIKDNRDQICDASPSSTLIMGNAGNGATWKVGSTFGTEGNDSCDFL